MKILLIFPSTGYYTRALSNPLGLLSIGSHLKRIGHDVKIYDRNVDSTKISKVFSDFRPDMVGVSVMSSRGLKDAIKVSKAAKERNICVAWGGQMPSMQPELVLENNDVDYVMIGEGEFTFEELIEVVEKKREPDSVDGIAFRRDGEIIKTHFREFADLSEMPITDWSLIDVDKYLQPYLGCEKMIYLYSSKGCPCSCTFCSNACFHRSTHRKRPNEYVIEEIKYLIENHGIDGVYFSDELWCLKRSDMLDFCRRVKDNNLKFRWGVQLRIGLFNEEDFKIMYDAGCRWVFFGIESGSKDMLKAIHKNIDYDKIMPTFEYMKKIGYTTVASFIIGYPDETEEQLKETVKMLNRISASLTPVFHFTPLPGTELYDEAIASGKYKPAASLKELSKVIATESVGKNLSKVPTKELRVIRSWYHWKSFSNKDALASKKPFEFAKQTILSGLHSISQKGPIYFFIDGFSAFCEFIYVFWYSHFYHEAIKKYGLNDKKN